MHHIFSQHARLTLSALMASALAVTSTQAFSAGDLLALGDLPGAGFFSEAYGVSGDGSVVVGASQSGNGSEAFRWTQSGGMVGLGDLAGGGFTSTAYGVSGDGLVIVGRGQSANGGEAFRWTQGGGMVGLGDLAGGVFFSTARAVNNDGTVVVGQSQSANGAEAFRWTQGGGMVGLGDLAGGGFFSIARGVSGDGTVVVGQSQSASGNEAFRWTQGGGMVGLGDLAGGTFTSEAYGISTDGSVVVGQSQSVNGNEAFHWTQGGGMVGLGDLAGGGFSSAALGVSGNGLVVVGTGEAASGNEAFRWTQGSGMETVTQWLSNNSVVVANNISLDNAQGANNDGSIIVGTGDFGNGTEAFIARVGNFGSGISALSNLNDSLSSTAQGASSSLRSASLLINGAHSRPMSRRVNSGQKTMWLAGDWGRDDHNSRDGTVGLTEVGMGYHFGFAQMNVSLGKTWADQDLINDGGVDADGTYVMVESIVLISEDKGLYATLGAYAHWGEADISRGYLNGGLSDTSSASPDTRTWGLRARIDWENAYALQTMQFSPYADLNYSDIRMDGYTETGGGFPAHFDRREDKITELRVGINMVKPLATVTIQLVGNLEIAHRFDDKGSSTSGQLLGLFSFDLEGDKYDSTWLKGGVGLEGRLGEGKASLMLNGTSEGEMPNAWLAASYQMTF